MPAANIDPQNKLNIKNSSSSSSSGLDDGSETFVTLDNHEFIKETEAGENMRQPTRPASYCLSAASGWSLQRCWELSASFGVTTQCRVIMKNVHAMCNYFQQLPEVRYAIAVVITYINVSICTSRSLHRHKKCRETKLKMLYLVRNLVYFQQDSC